MIVKVQRENTNEGNLEDGRCIIHPSIQIGYPYGKKRMLWHRLSMTSTHDPILLRVAHVTSITTTFLNGQLCTKLTGELPLRNSKPRLANLNSHMLDIGILTWLNQKISKLLFLETIELLRPPFALKAYECVGLTQDDGMFTKLKSNPHPSMHPSIPQFSSVEEVHM